MAKVKQAEVEEVSDDEAGSNGSKRRGRQPSSWLYDGLAEFIKQETDYDVDIQSMIYAGTFRTPFRQSDTYAELKAQHQVERKESTGPKRTPEERNALKEMREAKKAALADFEAQWAAKRGITLATSTPAEPKKSKKKAADDEEVF